MDRSLFYAKPRGATVTMARVVTMVCSPSQDRPDGGPRQYTTISRALFTWLTIRRVFDLSYRLLAQLLL